MKNLKSVIAFVGVIVKYSAIVAAIIKAIQVFHEEVEKIEIAEEK